MRGYNNVKVSECVLFGREKTMEIVFLPGKQEYFLLTVHQELGSSDQGKMSIFIGDEIGVLMTYGTAIREPIHKESIISGLADHNA